MVHLTENLVLARARANELSGVKTLNCWGSELTDVSVLKNVPNVEVINASVNNIESLEPFSSCENLRELYLRKNKIQNVEEISHLSGLKNLKLLWLSGNPFCESFSEEEYRLAVIKILPQIQKLDNTTISSSELQKALQMNFESSEREEASDHINNDCSAASSIDTNIKSELTNLPNTSASSSTDIASISTDKPEHSESSCSSQLESPVQMTLEETNQLRLQLGLNPISPEKYSSSVSQHYRPPKKHKKHTSGNNILTATLSLIEELDVDGLTTLHDAIQERLEGLNLTRLPQNTAKEKELLTT